MNKKRLVIGLLVLFGQLAWADEVKDTRQSLHLTPSERAFFLKDMRQMLSSVQQIVAAMASDNRQTMIEAAKLSGNQMARHTPLSIKQKLPASFQALGAPTHLGFEEFAIRAETDDLSELSERLGQLMNNCMTCHATFKVN